MYDMEAVPTAQLVGRDVELDVVDNLLERVVEERRRGAALVSGEAGVGKTRFMQHAAVRAEAAGVRVVIGRCIEHAGAVGPLRDVVVSLADQLDSESFELVLGPALPTLGRLAGRAATDSASAVPRDVVQLALGMFQRLVDRGPVMVVFEDLQWADPATSSLFASLAGAEWLGPVALLGTYRHRRLDRYDPLVPLLADVARSARPAQIWLDRLDAGATARLIRTLDPTIDDAGVHEIVLRSDGLPFYVEELVAARQAGIVGLPDSLRSVVLVRTAHLDDRHHEVLGVLAVAGRLDADVISEVAGLRADVIDVLIGALVRAGVVFVDHEGVQFRHELVREVFDDELPPWRRVSLHSALAAALEQHHPERFGAIARHRRAANQLPGALVASYAAGLAAMPLGAAAEAEQHFDTVLELWDVVSDPDKMAGAGLVDVLMAASDAARYAHRLDRAIQHATRAVSIASAAGPALGSDRWTVAAIWLRLHDLHRYAGRIGEGDRANQRALDLLDDSQPSLELAMALSFASIAADEQGDPNLAQELGRQAVAVAEQIDDDDARVYAHDALAASIAVIDRDSAHRHAQVALDCCGPSTPIEARLVATVGICNLSGHAGRWSDQIGWARRGRAAAAQVGFTGPREQLLLGHEVFALVQLGRWDEAEQVGIDGSRGAQPHPMVEWWLLTALVRQGRNDDARPFADRHRASAGAPDWSVRVNAVNVLAEFDVHDGRADDAVGLVGRAMSRPSAYGIVSLTSSGLAAVAEHCIGARMAGSWSVDAAWLTIAEGWLASMHSLAADDPAATEAIHARQAVAEFERLRGHSAAGDWSAIAGCWNQLEMPYEEARTRFLAAEAYLSGVAGRSSAARSGALEELVTARTIASELGALPLLTRIDSLAAQSGLGIHNNPPGYDAPPKPVVDPYGLTAREREVLGLVAAGRTNGEISSELYINTKTASVHVSNILRKLGVSNRVEAATRAIHEELVAQSRPVVHDDSPDI